MFVDYEPPPHGGANQQRRAVIEWAHAFRTQIAWDALVGVAVLVALGIRGVVGFFGYKLIHRLHAGPREHRPGDRTTYRRDAVAALIAFVLAYLIAMPFMNTTLIQGPVAVAWHGADIAYFVNFLATLAFYGGYRMLSRSKVPRP
ncbi:hypothetical protein [Mycolicibacterium sp. XJ870]